MFRFGAFELDERRGDLPRAGRPVAIQATPLRLLRVLLRNADRVVSKRELVDAVWPDVAVSDASLATALRQVRLALGGGDAPRIETLRRRGFRLRGPVTTAPAPPLEGHSRLVGRQRELERMAELLQRALVREGGTLLVSGDAGVGKTRLMQELTSLARAEGFLLLHGGCIEGEGATPFRPFAEALADLHGEIGTDGLREDVGERGGILATLWPALGERLGRELVDRVAIVEGSPEDLSGTQHLDQALVAVRIGAVLGDDACRDPVEPATALPLLEEAAAARHDALERLVARRPAGGGRRTPGSLTQHGAEPMRDAPPQLDPNLR